MAGAAADARAALLSGADVRRLTLRSGPRLLRRDPARRRVARQPQCRPVLFRQGVEHRRPAPAAQRVLRLDDQHGRSEALPAALDRVEGVHAEAHQRRRRSGPAEGERARRSPAGVAPGSHCRFRRRVLGAVPARDHLLDDGHPGVGQSPAVRVDEHHPRRRRPRVRGHLRAVDGSLAGDLRLRPGTRRGPPGTSRPTISPRR